MKIGIQIDLTCEEPEVIIKTCEMNEEIQQIMKKLSSDEPRLLTGFKDDLVEILEPSQIYQVVATDKKVYAITDKGKYVLKLRLYEVEKRLENNHFIRISNSEIVNLKKIKRFDLSFSGTICVELINHTVSYVSRRYVSKIKKVLGI